MREAEAPVPTAHLAAPPRRLHRVLRAALLREGIVPPAGALVDTLAIDRHGLTASLREVEAAEPATATVVARRDELLPAAGVCCPFTVFVCTAAHGRASLDEAVPHGEAPVADLLRAEASPASRRRWG